MTVDEAILWYKDLAELDYGLAESYHTDEGVYLEQETKCRERAENYEQLAEWLKELKAYREFADWLVKAVLEEDWEESADFYAEVLCRKLTKLGKLKVVDNKYMEVNDHADSD